MSIMSNSKYEVNSRQYTTRKSGLNQEFAHCSINLWPGIKSFPPESGRTLCSAASMYRDFAKLEIETEHFNCSSIGEAIAFISLF